MWVARPQPQAAIEEQGAERILPAIDARMQEVYWAEYRRDDHGLAELIDEELVIPPAQVPLPAGNGYTGIGSGWKTYADELGQRLDGRIAQTLPDALPDARYVAKLAATYHEQGLSVAPSQALPVYLRDQVAKKPSRKPL